MNEPRKTAQHGNAKAAYIKQLQHHSTETAKRVKLEFIRALVWLSIAKG